MDTEDYLSKHLGGNGGPPWPGHSSHNGWTNDPSKAPRDRRRGAHVNRDSPRGRFAPVGTLVSVPADEHGHVAREHVAVLLDRLFPLGRNWRREDVLLDLSGVRSVTPMFIRLVESLRSYLASQDRDLFVYDITRPDGRLRELDEPEGAWAVIRRPWGRGGQY